MNKEYYFPDGVPSKWKKMESLESGGNNLYLYTCDCSQPPNHKRQGSLRHSNNAELLRE